VSTSLKPGYKQTEVGVIPKEWQLVPFSELLDFRNGVNADKTAYGKGVRFINVLEQITYSHIHAPDITGRVSLSNSASDSYAVHYGDLVFNRTSETQAEVGLSAVYCDDEPVVFGGFVIRGRPKNESLDPSYSGYGFRSPIIRSQIIAKGQGAIRANVGQADLRQVLAPVPPLPEQRTIAEALGDVDALLGTLNQFIAKKRDLKQAAMQQLLTGHQRLPGFTGEWELKRLGDVAEIVMGQSPAGTTYNRRGIGAPLINGPTEFTEKHPVKIQWTSEPTKFCRNGDLLLCVGGSSTGRINIADDEYCIGRGVAAIRAKPDGDTSFITFQVNSAIESILAATTGSTFPNIDGKSIRGIEITTPCLDEQTAIAAVLSDMDAEIGTLAQRLDKTRALKQGMMQELLTGRTRLV
jgi:type I restriction enzyme S subunit